MPFDAKRARSEVRTDELHAHALRLDRLQIGLFGLWLPLWPLAYLLVAVNALAGWGVGHEHGGLVGGVLGAAASGAAVMLFLEATNWARVVPLGLLPRKRRLERRRLDRCLDRCLLRRSLAADNRRLVLTDPASPEWTRLDARIDEWRLKLAEAERDLDALERELAGRYEDWSRFLAGDPRGQRR